MLGRLATVVSVEVVMPSVGATVVPSVDATVVSPVDATEVPSAGVTEVPSVDATEVPSVDATVVPAAGTVVPVLLLSVAVVSPPAVPPVVAAAPLELSTVAGADSVGESVIATFVSGLPTDPCLKISSGVFL